MEEARVVNSTWQDLKEKFIRDFYFSIEEECFKEAIEEIDKFIEPTNIDTSTKVQLLELTCINITTNLIIFST